MKKRRNKSITSIGRMLVTNRTRFEDRDVCGALWFARKQLDMDRLQMAPVHYVTVSERRIRFDGQRVVSKNSLGAGETWLVIPMGPGVYPFRGCDARLRESPYEVEYTLFNWQEMLVHLAAHEFMHALGVGSDGLPGGAPELQGEYYCEQVAKEAAEKFRHRRGLAIASVLEATELMRDVSFPKS